MRNFIEGAALVTVIGLMVGGVLLLLLQATDIAETANCAKLQQMEQDFPAYETATRTAERCESLGVNVFKYVD